MKLILSNMNQKLSKLDCISVINNLVYQFYESGPCFGLFSYPHYIAFTTVQGKRSPPTGCRRSDLTLPDINKKNDA